ncbi:MAG: DUF1638 domain-containing protein [Desulfobacteraceae bacterium]|nr:MAG: DUF1638 domain-containing protein [Desulfobacteraceae bacterium]
MKASQQRLIVPRCHDCITLFLGSCAAYCEAIKARSGTYYLIPGWIEEKRDQLGIIEEECAPRVGRKVAIWAME